MERHELQKLIEQILNNGIIDDGLIPYFDQHGKLRIDLVKGLRKLLKSEWAQIKLIHLPECQRTMDGKMGPILRTSFIWKCNNPLTITYSEIQGSLVVSTNVKIHAANLRHVGGHVIIRSSHKIYLPNLRTIGGKFECAKGFLMNAQRLREVGGACRLTGVVPPKLERVGGSMVSYWVFDWEAPCLKTVAGSLLFHRAEIVSAPVLEGVVGDLVVDSLTKKLTMPKLRYVGGDFLAGKVTDLRVPMLRSIGRDLNTGSAADFYHPDIRVGGNWKIHPTAHNDWVIRDTARRALRGDPVDFEL